jgi:NADH-quinone oxidoreductase subunit L
VNGVADVLRSMQNGQIQRYAAVLAVTAAVLLWVVLGAGG